MSAMDNMFTYYRDNGCLSRLADDLMTYGKQGCVVLSDDFVVLARPVCTSWTDEEVVNVSKNCSTSHLLPLTDAPNAWHVHFMAGKLERLFEVMPYPLPFATFQRNGGKLRKYSLTRIQDGIR